ncbi:50S ribosomal protein L27 [Candidatus Roizmanbacteria bacterium CG_4_10_14_0_2_um_filter_36_35]|uniref:Large ribosomal subunit protein bL27 n=4 Tax=Candidatus Roizmaniibacteriota TaxID=1752723 RepID=A0A2M7BVF5_9BACT|nr:MAG: 50S ribosomal protein L27 [Candidatus Roizmanbacteria bacterium CG11_big_fil_rev_8_21_14_0_20_35_14]PIV10538.1 MAG: 50S ribosomal protein L27 [Candidatus Roizmanbacteria bacterium CG03_land_8_20_14_0_80_35_26]PIZ67225.1 MAG: 50S ribosomal protein L27 [Candidatus Roizmanbacteria bacterium CG_4_10_14_0_2_um_filter_36_35]PJC31968.1 MAG: 50S ribosomal protein L27 [Candidatus Roizmanbacteria bacterium CG_4_9_14_0_2_um_filter_36_12]PJC79930.1 MAG: 50S ribosomal protein L27 [Candidatus Roizman
MAHTKAQKTVKGNRDSQSKRLGVKVYGGSLVSPGNIIIRQRGTKVNAGSGTMLGRDFTIMALKKGTVKFFQKRGEAYVAVV